MKRALRPIVLTAGLALTLAACGGASEGASEPTLELALEPTGAATHEPTASIPEEPAQAGESSVFEITSEGTEARFIIDEVLNGAPKTVVGVTRAVRGEIRVDPENPAQTVLGPIEVEVGDLTTDSNFRNGAIRNFILATGDFPVVTFTPTSIEGLPPAVAVGEPFTFEIVGDLTVRDVTLPVTFVVTVTAESEDRLSGTSSTQILRSDFGLTIPSVPQVASVEDEVILELDFVALRTR